MHFFQPQTTNISLISQKKKIQYNLNGSNPDGSFTVDHSNSFFSPYKILPIAQAGLGGSVGCAVRPGGRGFNPRRGRQHSFV